MVDINFAAIYWHKIYKKKCYYNIKPHRFIWKNLIGGVSLFRENFYSLLLSRILNSDVPSAARNPKCS